ncbi:hypothetical protein MKW92_031639, partial [Papaver armeniacum]
MIPSTDLPDEDCLAIEFSIVRPGRPAEQAPGIAKQLSDVILRYDVYCLDADGSLFDAALLSAVAAFSSR